MIGEKANPFPITQVFVDPELHPKTVEDRSGLIDLIDSETIVAKLASIGVFTEEKLRSMKRPDFASFSPIHKNRLYSLLGI